MWWSTSSMVASTEAARQSPATRYAAPYLLIPVQAAHQNGMMSPAVTE
jgi:hypothetical protein